MDAKLVLLLSCLMVLLLMNQQVEADFFFNPQPPLDKDLESLGMICVPGRTVIRLKEQTIEILEEDDSGDEDYGSGRKSQMTSPSRDGNCQICVCSSEGKHEYCRKRSALDVNECIVIGKAMEEFNMNLPYDHTKSLAYRIRRDYIWHKDEIPYEAKARCARGHSYYSNSPNANDTDIDIASDIESLLDYSDKDICFYCVCSMHGNSVGCITRSPWFCEYYRQLRSPEYARNTYAELFQQDRPTYFRQLSYRLRRTMDDGLQELISTGGDALCCGHPNGHRRQIHNSVKTKLRILKRKLPKENLLGGRPKGDYDDFIVNND